MSLVTQVQWVTPILAVCKVVNSHVRLAEVRPDLLTQEDIMSNLLLWFIPARLGRTKEQEIPP